MKKVTSYSFEKNYKVRAAIITLIGKFVFLELLVALIALGLSALTLSPENLFILRIILLSVNILIFIYFLLVWYFQYYIVSPHGISKSSGIIFRKTTSVDIPAIRSVQVYQGLFGKTFNYGSLKLDSPLIKNLFEMDNLPNPYRHANLIEKARLKQITDEKSETIIPSA
ncbi:PH domain-containing protein [Candidatus Peregrinibacteria bacterium]|nr:PH domain-containing protein [Candidatus Peregrinibacteria bacterium]